MKSDRDNNIEKNVHGDLVSGDQIYLKGNIRGSGIVIGHGTKAYIRSSQQSPATALFATVYQQMKASGEGFDRETVLLVQRLEWALDTGADDEQLHRWLQQLANADRQVFEWVSEELREQSPGYVALLASIEPENGGDDAGDGTPESLADLRQTDWRTVEQLAHSQPGDAHEAADRLQQLADSYPHLRHDLLAYLLEAPETSPTVRVIARQILK